MAIKILIVDDDPDIRDVLKLTLSEENYEILEAGDGEEALKIVHDNQPDLILLDYKIPKIDGREVCRRIKKDLLLRHLPIIMVTGKGDINDKVNGIDAGADDYVVKPFEPKELLARIRMILRHTERDLEANPLTRLPGNVSILNELSQKIKSKALFAVCYLDLDKFKSYNDKYGFEHGDEVIKETARLLVRSAKGFGNPDDFIGHIGGDDFVIVTTPDKTDNLCQKIILEFESLVPSFYNEKDRKNSFIIAKDREGKEQKVPLLSISIGVVTNEHRKITHVAQIGEIGAELKAYAKSLERSNYVKDQRKAVKPFL
ncbi:MAG: diguanylate cyclase response regulator [Candidatus Omnitrophica bacterium CG08_land_8_20_14_0_20_41_16]|uniref:Diguanylate cyclase response regulator n=1 Tax=Candidatus Sherwoodlollariibacterium unditelluris TaxID=1974757 RepID=A0A2G9YJP9_9BACT|nr:MAG: diguanylate cyclase response regulator [Candidatus Omnitrophica bacterium CG23_combo_of_CG06-09_8_20_14_all_41_10]PIS33354.1 MAG: diguanylate cyclase response regulator [Candidatus Omnitrophica bacterium CG08_land_8_20_14_0_20_41_16]